MKGGGGGTHFPVAFGKIDLLIISSPTAAPQSGATPPLNGPKLQQISPNLSAELNTARGLRNELTPEVVFHLRPAPPYLALRLIIHATPPPPILYYLPPRQKTGLTPPPNFQGGGGAVCLLPDE